MRSQQIWWRSWVRCEAAVGMKNKFSRPRSEIAHKVIAWQKERSNLMKYFKPPNMMNQLPNRCNIFGNWFAILKLLTQCDKIWPHFSIVETVVDFKTLKPVSFQLSILHHVCSSFSKSHDKGIFWSRTDQKEEKTTLIIVEYMVRHWDCCHRWFQDFETLFFIIEYFYAHYLWVCKVSTGAF